MRRTSNATIVVVQQDLKRLQAANDQLTESYNELSTEYALLKRRYIRERRWGAFWAVLFILTAAARVAVELGVLQWISSK